MEEIHTDRQYKLRSISFAERCRLNDLLEKEQPGTLRFCGEYVAAALAEIDGVAVTDENREAILMDLSNADILAIGIEAIRRFNPTPKKKSS